MTFVHGTSDGYAFNLDSAYTTAHIFSISANLKVVRDEPRTLVAPELELTLWLLLNIGGGVGYYFGDEHGPVIHAFAGLPLPVPTHGAEDLGWGPFKTLFFEPYYRASLFYRRSSPNGELIPEAGIFIKVST